ncbi:hypothetical protein BGZ80_007345 [Entomortierella chlamydospora]|uniref:Glycerophosphocholine acyltransferase 1 n=1 Tax=Entomortierella chlamydospora TaxID=101097 RepID=A0A9P6MY75_9FUNG|nr:hypothetical protein BGZ80_007345 [Entomortierella chlamydospora]
MSDPEQDLTLERSISAPEPGELSYEDSNASETSSPPPSPSLMPNIFTQVSFSLDAFISQNLEDELSELPVLANQVYQNLRSDLSKTKHQIRHRVGTTKRQIQSQVDNTASNINASIMVWKKNMKKASVVRLMDKIAFTLGMFECCCTPWLVSQYPEWIPLVHTVQSVILIAVRYVLYKKKSWHLFLLDMCYFVNAVVLLYLYVFPQSQALLGAVWLLSQGPLAFAIITWRNSLVLHSLDKVTSVYIHMSPPITLYVVRWLYPDPTRYPALRDMSVLPTLSSLAAAIGIYLTWQVAYYIFVVVRQREKIKAGKRVTSYTWLLNDPKGGAISKVAHTFGEKYSILTFMAMQLTYTFVTCLFALLLYRNFKLNTIFLVSLFIVSVWNGACYYMEVFSKQYEKHMEKLAADMTSAMTANHSTEKYLELKDEHQKQEHDSHAATEGAKTDIEKKNE